MSTPFLSSNCMLISQLPIQPAYHCGILVLSTNVPADFPQVRSTSTSTLLSQSSYSLHLGGTMLANLLLALIWYLEIQGAGTGPINPTPRAVLPLREGQGNKEGLWFPEQRCIAPPQTARISLITSNKRGPQNMDCPAHFFLRTMVQPSSTISSSLIVWVSGSEG